MALEKNTILLLTRCKKTEILASTSFIKLKEKGTLVNNITLDDYTLEEVAQTFTEAVKNEKLIVGDLGEVFDLCIIDAGSSIESLDAKCTEVLEKSDRKTVIVLASEEMLLYYGSGTAKGKTLEYKVSLKSLVPTLAYIGNLPMPENSYEYITFGVLKDINVKFKEIKKLQDTITNMESALERKTRQPWDKHDCA